MGGEEILRSIIALLFVLALIMLIAWLVRRFGLEKSWNLGKGGSGRLSLVERMTIDPKRQVVLIRRDHKEHLLMLGANEALVIESFESNKTPSEQDGETPDAS